MLPTRAGVSILFSPHRKDRQMRHDGKTVCNITENIHPFVACLAGILQHPARGSSCRGLYAALAELRWRDALVAAEHAGEVVGIVESEFFGNLVD